MQIVEMRRFLEADFKKNQTRNGELPDMPPWVVRRMYELRRGLPLTPVTGVETRSLRGVMLKTAEVLEARAAKLKAVVLNEDPDGEKEKIRLMAEALKLL